MRAALALLVCVGCGATDLDGPALDPAATCVPAGERIATLVRLLEEGRLAGLHEVTQGEFTEDARTRLIQLVFDVLDALPPGTIPGLAAFVDTGLADEVAEQLVVVLTASTRYEALGVAGELLERCTGAPLLRTVEELISDGNWRAALLDRLAGGVELPIDIGEIEHRPGFQALLRALLVSISDPGFTPAEILEIVPDFEPILGPMLQAGDRRESLRLVTGCLLEVDPDDELAGLVFDVLAAGVDGEALLGMYEGGIEETVDRILLPILGLLVHNETARASAVLGLSTLLRPDVAAKVIPDLIVLVEEGAVTEILDLLVAVATGQC